ncbi:aquaporin Z [Paenarthrobacter nicotinovorans]|jgi:aquaporin Z|uniref:Aquaporin Z n=2 Tax=Paenarthrobacter nicotinovorans TaxID=29320 RepID=A0ABT9TK59_PAENI|nr:aquaporin Z [Paenarthrobacter nicotinovorans]BCW09895.1 aquaporin Z [Arthrobacter sp. NtRootA2]BCW13976.1 aquaporin Z [Arthrobacter sp. NtRootA4]BCW22311.1 aquaporin Z [Arthrobacter sp. NtRootC7]BCW26580.1 aquaporin Z [Arthrobacter sp. NtRootC45]BCW30850.1 aquaporin Z [Arthrobacter sp. NtRootD5]
MASRNTKTIPRPTDPGAGPALVSRLGAEALGTFILVFGGVGTALFAASFPDPANAVGVGFLGVSLAFGLTVVAGAYAFGHVSGGHFNPAVTIGLAVAGRFPAKDIAAYIGAQLVGGAAGSSVLAVIAAGGSDGFFTAARAAGFASNGFGDHSPGGFGLGSALMTEFVLTAVFVLVILGVTDRRAQAGFAALAIGFSLTLIHLISIPVTNTSVNPARSIATALYADNWALGQLWVFIVAPIAGAIAAAALYRVVFAAKTP